MRHILSAISFLLVAPGIFSQNTSVSSSDTDSLTHELNEVVVTASAPAYKLTKGGVMSKISGTPLSNAGTCFDVVALMPGVRSDDGNIEIPGKGTPQIYINGRKLIDLSELHRLSSKEIQSVEVIYNPGARYGAEVKSVILIKTVKKRGDGLSGSLQVSDRLARYNSQSGNFSLNYRFNGLDIFGLLSADNSKRYQKQHTRTLISASDGNYFVDATTGIYPKSMSYHGNIGINWQINGNHYLGAKYEYISTPYSKSRWVTDENVSIDNHLSESIDYLTLWDRRTLPENLFNLYYSGKTGPFAVNVTNDYYHQRNSSRQNIVESDNTGLKEHGSDSRIRNTMFASRGIVTYEFDKNEIEGGYEFTSTGRNDRFINSNDDLPDADSRIRENTVAAFLSFVIPVDKFELAGGIRYEHTFSRYYEHDVLIPSQSRKYGRWFPNIDFSFPIGKANFTLSYTAKTKRPRYSQLSGSIQYDDRFTYETGNPLLVSEMIHDISLAGVYRWIFFSAGYQYDKDAIVSVIKALDENTPANIMTYTNFNHVSKYNVIVSLSPKIGRWSPRVRLNLLGQSFDVKTLNGRKSMNNPLLFWNFYNTFSLGKGFMLSADVTGRTWGDMDVVTLKPSWQINLGLTLNLNDWYLQLAATDIFRTARNSMITYGSRMRLDKWNYSDSQALRLMIRYSFNTASSKYKGSSAGISERQRF